MRGLFVLTILGCGGSDGAAPDGSSGSDAAADAAPDAAVSNLPALAFCSVADPKNITAAFTATPSGDAIAYSCVTPCTDWTQCTFAVVNPQGQPIKSARNQMQLQGLAFVVDGMAGHLAFTPDGTDVVLTHAGAGGTSLVNVFDRALQTGTTLKTVTLGWEHGTPNILSQTGGGWFTRKATTPSSVRELAARPAAVLRWVKDNFAVGHKLGTVGSSMGTVATLGAHVWYGLDDILDYQMLIGGPGMWDVNAGCGRVHIGAGFCDVDATPCTGNAMSSYGNDDPACPAGPATNQCRVPTIMAPLNNGGSSYNNVINYVHMTTACAPMVTDSRDATLDASSMATTVASWTFHGRVDFVADEGGVQPPDADQGMGEGHMLYMYNAITSAKGWIDNEGTHHGDAFDKTPALITAAAAHVIAGMQ